MSSGASPFLVGLFAASLLLTLIWVVSATYRRLERFRMHRRSRADDKTTSELWMHRRRVPDEKLGERSSPTADADATGAGAPKVEGGRSTDIARRARERLEEAALDAKRTVVAVGPAHPSQQASELEHAALGLKRMKLDLLAAIQEAERAAEDLLLDTERQCATLVHEAEAQALRKSAEIAADGRRRANELLEEAELEAMRIVVDTGEERSRLLSELERERSLLELERTKFATPTPIEAAEQQAEELLVAAGRRRDELLRASEAEAERRATAVEDGARRHAQELLEEARLEAARVVAAAGERERLVGELARERSVLEETRTRLAAFLAEVLREVEAAPAAGDSKGNVRDLDEVRAVRTSAGGDR
jgi:hypothetical protein